MMTRYALPILGMRTVRLLRPLMSRRVRRATARALADLQLREVVLNVKTGGGAEQRVFFPQDVMDDIP